MEKVRIEVHPSLEQSLRKLRDKLQRKINKNGVRINIPNCETSRIAAKILDKRIQGKTITVNNLFRTRGRGRFV